MKRFLFALVMASLGQGMAGAAQAECYADYKAKRDNPLQLHYGVIALPEAACGSRGAAVPVIAERIGRAGWFLLDVVSIFGPAGLDDKERKESAGDYFLRF